MSHGLELTPTLRHRTTTTDYNTRDVEIVLSFPGSNEIKHATLIMLPIEQ
jgi:hypothetical protein